MISKITTAPNGQELINKLNETIEQVNKGGGGGADGAVTSVNGKIGEVTLTAKDVGAIQFKNQNIDDANQWLENGYTKINAQAPNLHLPDECTDVKDKWGILFNILENEERGTGSQTFYPIDGKFKGRIFVRAMTNVKSSASGWGKWLLIPTTADIPNSSNFATKQELNGKADETTVKGYVKSVTISGNALNVTNGNGATEIIDLPTGGGGGSGVEVIQFTKNDPRWQVSSIATLIVNIPVGKRLIGAYLLLEGGRNKQYSLAGTGYESENYAVYLKNLNQVAISQNGKETRTGYFVIG